jgi:hypothetical protein
MLRGGTALPLWCSARMDSPPPLVHSTHGQSSCSRPYMAPSAQQQVLASRSCCSTPPRGLDTTRNAVAASCVPLSACAQVRAHARKHPLSIPHRPHSTPLPYTHTHRFSSPNAAQRFRNKLLGDPRLVHLDASALQAGSMDTFPAAQPAPPAGRQAAKRGAQHPA